MAHLHDPAAAYSETPPAQQEGGFARPAPYRDGATFTGKFAPSKWPTNSKAQSVDVGVNRNAGGELSRTLVAIMPAPHSVLDFLMAGFNAPVLPLTQRYCRTLVRQIADLLDIEWAGVKAA